MTPAHSPVHSWSSIDYAVTPRWVTHRHPKPNGAAPCLSLPLLSYFPISARGRFYQPQLKRVALLGPRPSLLCSQPSELLPSTLLTLRGPLSPLPIDQPSLSWTPCSGPSSFICIRYKLKLYFLKPHSHLCRPVEGFLLSIRSRSTASVKPPKAPPSHPPHGHAQE